MIRYFILCYNKWVYIILYHLIIFYIILFYMKFEEKSFALIAPLHMVLTRERIT